MANKELIHCAYEVACLMDSKRVCSDLLSALLRLQTTSVKNFVGKELYNKAGIAREAVERLATELSITLRDIEDGFLKG